jgi:Ribbon-helix-helix protein, copG family
MSWDQTPSWFGLGLGLGPAQRFGLPSDLILGYPIFMAKSIRDIPKKRRGRPSTGGRREGILVRLDPEQLEAVDDWIIQRDEVSRPEAIRRLVELGLKAKK